MSRVMGRDNGAAHNLSGLLAGQEPAVLAAYRRSRFHLGRRVALAGWHTLVLERR